MILKSKLQDFSTLNIKALLHNIITLFHNHFSNFLQLLSLNNSRCAVISWMTHETVPPLGIPAAGASLPAPLHFAKLSLLSCLWIWTSLLFRVSVSTKVSASPLKSFCWKLSAQHLWDPKITCSSSTSSKVLEEKKQCRKCRAFLQFGWHLLKHLYIWPKNLTPRTLLFPPK